MGVRRIERVGDAIVAWDVAGPRVVYSHGADFQAIPPAFQTAIGSEITAPDAARAFRRPRTDPCCAASWNLIRQRRRSSRAEAKLADKLEAAALLGMTRVALKGAGGELLSYTPRTRCVSVLAKATELPPSWELMLAGSRVCVVPTESKGQGDLLVVENQATLRKVGHGVRSVIQAPDRVCWIQADGSVMALGRNGDEAVLSTVASAGVAAPRVIDEIVCDSKGILWWLAQGEVTGYDPGTGPAAAKTRSVERVGSVQGRAVGVVPAGAGLQDVVTLENGVKLNSESFGHVGLGATNVLGWSMRGDIFGR